MIKLVGRPLHQWDIGRKVRIVPQDGVQINEVHFANNGDMKALVVRTTVGDSGITADIPNKLLQTGKDLVAYAVFSSDTAEHTEYRKHFSVTDRPKPEDYVYTEKAVYSYKAIFETIKNGTGKNALVIGQGEAIGDYSVAEGMDTRAMGVAAHAEGANNISLSRAGHAEGSNNQIGSKAFTVLAVDPGNKTYTLDDTTGLQEAVDKGYLYSCNVCFHKTGNGEHSSMQKENYGKITAINGNVVTLNPFYDVTSEVTDGVFETKDSYIVDDMDTEENTFRVIDLPNVGTRTIGDSSHVEGDQCKTLSKDAHAEGFKSLAYGSYAHVEGNRTKAGFGGHAEGRETTASGKRAHAEGFQTTASGEQSHSEGWRTASKGKNSHAEGFETVASGEQSHAEGKGSIAEGYSSHAENNGKAYGANSHAEGSGGMAYGLGSHAEGEVTKAYGSFSHAEGGKAETTNLTRNNSYGTLPVSEVIQIKSNVAEGARSHAEGEGTHAYGRGSHAEGLYTYAGGYNSHAEGQLTQALASGCHAEGWDTVAKGINSHAEGNGTAAIGTYSHAEGKNTVVYSDAGHVQGRYNEPDFGGGYAHIVGNGTHDGRSNAHTLSWEGNAWFCGKVSGTGADYAEYFEWADGNPNDEDRVGLIVALEGDKIRPANSGDDILGVVSGTAMVVGDNAEWEWQDKYLCDDYGRVIWEMVEEFDEEGKSMGFFPHRQINPNYDPKQEYVRRVDRPEWDTVGLVGKLHVTDDGSCTVGGYATVGANGIATASGEKTNMRVMKRIKDNIVLVFMK